jgi:uncharacterized protein with HEPN domain
MLAAAEAVTRYVERGRAAFDADSAIRDAIVHQIEVMGEAAKAVLAADSSLETELPEIEWSELARMRDKMIHQYWAVNAEIVWATASHDIPAIKAVLLKALAGN